MSRFFCKPAARPPANSLLGNTKKSIRNNQNSCGGNIGAVHYRHDNMSSNLGRQRIWPATQLGLAGVFLSDGKSLPANFQTIVKQIHHPTTGLYLLGCTFFFRRGFVPCPSPFSTRLFIYCLSPCFDITAVEPRSRSAFAHGPTVNPSFSPLFLPSFLEGGPGRPPRDW